MIPVFLRWRKGDSFKPGAWTLGQKYRWVNPIAVVWVIITSIYFCLPFYGPDAVWFSDNFSADFANFTPAGHGRPGDRDHIAWFLGMNKRYTGPIRQIEFDEGMGIKEETSRRRAAAAARAGS